VHGDDGDPGPAGPDAADVGAAVQPGAEDAPPEDERAGAERGEGDGAEDEDDGPFRF